MTQTERDATSNEEIVRAMTGDEEREMYFDPGTGKIMVVRPGEGGTRDAIPVTVIPKNGVYLTH
jgi:hypothetical protein